VKLARAIRSRPPNGLALGDVVTSALVSELIRPSKELWLVSGWVSDITVIDNSQGDYDDLLEGRTAAWSLSETLALLSRRGVALRVALRDEPHNKTFYTRLQRQLRDRDFTIHLNPDLHEKLMCGSNWLITGSMNFTLNGMERNEENVVFQVDDVAVAQQLVELHQRWDGS